MRTGTNPMTNCSLILVALFLIDLGLGDSPLVILSLCSLVLFFVISSLLASFVFLFFLFLFSFFVSFSVLSVLPYVFMRSLFNIYFLTYQKKKKLLKPSCIFHFYTAFKVELFFVTLLIQRNIL